MNKNERQLMQLYETLNESGQAMLRKYAEFLCTQPENTQAKDIIAKQPKEISAADNESVVGAIKRLSDSYFMLDRAKLLNSASILMAQHVMQGREANEVIKELEASFASAYELYCQAIDDYVATDNVATDKA